MVTRIRARRWSRIGLVLLAGAVAFVIWLLTDSQAAPKLADLARRVMGDQAVLRLEECVFGVENRLDKWRYAREVKSGRAEPLPRLEPLLPPPPPSASTEPSTDLMPIALRNNGDEEAGQWVDKGYYRRTYVYPETELPSIADVIVIDPRRARLHLVCGARDPTAFGNGRIPEEHRDAALMAFSGGFQYRHGHDGIVIDGKALKPLKKNGGTLVVLRDGRVKVGRWGKDFTRVTPDMHYARQCLLLVENGAFNEHEPYKAYALDRRFFVYRTAIGVRADGRVVYAGGDKLSAAGLAKAMIAAGAVSAICLDMNRGNATCGLFTRDDKGRLDIKPPTPRFLNPDRFLGSNYRDFFYLVKK
ncbi:MAG: phosphodiester glycosidase family protein [Armatimonadota bacterium]